MPLALDAIAEVGPGGHFFGAAHTLERYETAFYRPLLSDWRNFETWQEDGARTATERANRIWELPKSYEALVNRRQGLEAWTRLHGGFFGRAPDHVASCISGMVMGLEVFAAYDRERAQALADYYRYARDNNLYLTYVIINPQADRSKSAAQQKSEYLTAGVVDRDATGVTVRGAKMLATGGIMANEVFVTCIQPLAPGDEKYALSFAIPMNAKGLKILSRKSYEAAASSVMSPRCAMKTMLPSEPLPLLAMM